MLKKRVLSGMRTTNRMHLGNYFGALKNWIALQDDYECFFGAMNWHAITDAYKEPETFVKYTRDMIIDWVAFGIDPNKSVIFIQSEIPELLELNMLFQMITPLPWLDRVTTWKDMIEDMKKKDAYNLGRYAYPVLQTADIALFKGILVPVGPDQVPHLELSRELVRRFNFLYGSPKASKSGERGEAAGQSGQGGQNGQADRSDQTNQAGQQDVTQILPEPQALLSTDKTKQEAAMKDPTKMAAGQNELVILGIDGRKMSKSYGNTFPLLAEPEEVVKICVNLPTDPARVKKSDPGNPDICPEYTFHKLFSSESDKETVQENCRGAKWGCRDCKMLLAQNINAFMKKPLEKRKELLNNPHQVDEIIGDGCSKARAVGKQTMAEVKSALGWGK